MSETFAQQLEPRTVLTGQEERRGERVHEAGDGGALLGSAMKEYVRLAEFEEADDEIVLVAGEVELAVEGRASAGQRVEQRFGGEGKDCSVRRRSCAVRRGWTMRSGRERRKNANC